MGSEKGGVWRGGEGVSILKSGGGGSRGAGVGGGGRGAGGGYVFIYQPDIFTTRDDSSIRETGHEFINQ